MARQSQRRRAPLRAALSVAIVMAVAGLMFTANARLARDEPDRHPENFGELVEQESNRGDELFVEVEELRQRVDVLTAAMSIAGPELAPDQDRRVGVLTGRTAVQGDGLRISLQDAPSGRLQPDGVQPDDLVVHQQDLEGVINALWAGGAEAMTLQGQRVSSLTAFRCVGNVLSLHGRVYSPPYVVEAIGDQQEMVDAVIASPAVGTYLDYVESVGLGWKVEEIDDVTMPAFTGSANLKYAQVPDGTDIYQ